MRLIIHNTYYNEIIMRYGDGKGKILFFGYPFPDFSISIFFGYPFQAHILDIHSQLNSEKVENRDDRTCMEGIALLGGRPLLIDDHAALREHRVGLYAEVCKIVHQTAPESVGK